MQEQAQAARKRAAGTMDEYTFIAEDSTAADQIDSAPAVQNVSAEQLYKNELAQEMQVMAPCMKLSSVIACAAIHDILHAGLHADTIQGVFSQLHDQCQDCML